jgi:hypothetical protein
MGSTVECDVLVKVRTAVKTNVECLCVLILNFCFPVAIVAVYMTQDRMCTYYYYYNNYYICQISRLVL